MQGILQNRKVVGSFLIGFALVAGSYTLSNFGERPAEPTSAGLYAVVAQAPTRTYIEVADADGNGIEDWREEFIQQQPIIAPNPSAVQTVEKPPFEATTLTDQMSVQLLESTIRAQTMGSVGLSQEAMVVQIAERARTTVQDRIYNTPDIAIIPTTPSAIRTYGNTMGQILINNNVPDYEDELTILDRAVRQESQAELDKLQPIADMYKNLRDQSLRTPVPDQFVKQHLDLINVYNALYENVADMQQVLSDPVVSLLRIKRYQDDATGLLAALNAMYNSLVPHASLFNQNDPVIVFVAFSPN